MPLTSQMRRRREATDTCGYGPIWVGLGHQMVLVAQTSWATSYCMAEVVVASKPKRGRYLDLAQSRGLESLHRPHGSSLHRRTLSSLLVSRGDTAIGRAPTTTALLS